MPTDPDFEVHLTDSPEFKKFATLVEQQFTDNRLTLSEIHRAMGSDYKERWILTALDYIGVARDGYRHYRRVERQEAKAEKPNDWAFRQNKKAPYPYGAMAK